MLDFGVVELNVFDTATGVTRRVAATDDADQRPDSTMFWVPQWSPNGQHLGWSVGSPSEIQMALISGGAVKMWTIGRQPVFLKNFSPDGRYLMGESANDKEPILPGHVYVGPPDYHLLVEPGYFVLSTDEPVRFSRPSVDVMFLSAADAYSPDVVGIVLTGANADGARGLRAIVDRGGYAVVQDPESAEVPVMPRAAIKAVPTACVLPLERIAPHLAAIRGRRMPPCRPVPA